MRGRVYLWALAVVVATALVLGVLRWPHDVHLLILGALAGAAGFLPPVAFRPDRLGWRCRRMAVDASSDGIGFAVDSRPYFADSRAARRIGACHNPVMDQQAAQRFAQQWITLWNARDLDGVLEHFADDVVFTSPTAARTIDGSSGVVRGKAALRAYWSTAMRNNPELRFDLLGVYAGINTLVINFRHQTGVHANEVLIFDGSVIVEGHATHAAWIFDPAS